MKSEKRALRGDRLAAAISQALAELNDHHEGRLSFSRTELASYINSSSARFGGTTTRQTLAIEPWVSFIDDTLKKLKVASRQRDGNKAIGKLKRRVERLERENAELRHSHHQLLRIHARIFDALRENGVDISILRDVASLQQAGGSSRVIPFVLPVGEDE